MTGRSHVGRLPAFGHTDAAQRRGMAYRPLTPSEGFVTRWLFRREHAAVGRPVCLRAVPLIPLARACRARGAYSAPPPFPLGGFRGSMPPSFMVPA